MVDRKATASYLARLAVVNWRASSVAVTEMPAGAPSSFSAAMPSGMESWRKPAVLEKTRTFLPFVNGSLENSKSSTSYSAPSPPRKTR